MKAKKLNFSYENVCDFLGWLRDFYTKKYRDDAWGDLDGVSLYDITDAQWDKAMQADKFIYGFDSLSRSEYPDTKQLYLNFEQHRVDPDTGEYYLDLDSEMIGPEMFDKYLCQCAAQQ
ncbi:MAG: hypothetical protein IJ517_00165 [Alphaproteobacteria bacterium]|nr:hypothetical protein [Alphaproteobacteria bacterium]